MWQETLKLVLISILNGILLGILKQLRLTILGPEFISSNNSSNRFDNANRFVLFFCSLSTGAFVISLIKANFCVIGLHGPADTIFAAHRVDNKLYINLVLQAL